MSKALVAGLGILVILLAGLNVYQYFQLNESAGDLSALEETYPRSIDELKGPERDKFIGKNVTAEGFFVLLASKYPALVSSLEDLLINSPIPDDRYLELSDVTSRAREELMAEAGAMVRVTGTVLEMEGDVVLKFREHRVIRKPGSLTPWVLEKLETIPIEIAVEHVYFKYAVLISGGWNTYFAQPRYWNDMKYMYSVLVNAYHYNPENIYVIYEDGIGEDTQMPVNYSATVSNVNTAFNALAARMTARDSLFIFTTNHGGGFNPLETYGKRNSGLIDVNGDEPEAGYSEAAYGEDFNKDGDKLDTVKIDEVLCLYYEQELSDDALADLLASITCHRMIIFMEQCFSGGFIHDLSAPNRFILTACGEEEYSWGMSSSSSYDEFSYYFTRAVNGQDWSADTNSDQNICMTEAFNYASNKDKQNEDPHYDDNGDSLGHMGPLPTGGDGTAGNNEFL